jgi:hypothetical protein
VSARFVIDALVIRKFDSELASRLSMAFIRSESLLTVRNAHRCDHARSPTRTSLTSPFRLPAASNVSLPVR